MQLNKFPFGNILWFACLAAVLGETLAGWGCAQLALVLQCTLRSSSHLHVNSNKIQISTRMKIWLKICIFYTKEMMNLHELCKTSHPR